MRWRETERPSNKILIRNYNQYVLLMYIGRRENLQNLIYLCLCWLIQFPKYVRGVSEKFQDWVCCVSYEWGTDYQVASPCDVISREYITVISALCIHWFFFFICFCIRPPFQVVQQWAQSCWMMTKRIGACRCIGTSSSVFKPNQTSSTTQRLNARAFSWRVWRRNTHTRFCVNENKHHVHYTIIPCTLLGQGMFVTTHSIHAMQQLTVTS